MQLTHALTLVPERKREEEKDDGKFHWSNIVDFLSSSKNDEPVIEFSLPKLIAFYNKKSKQDNDIRSQMQDAMSGDEKREIMRGVKAMLYGEQAAEEANAVEEVVERVVWSGVKRLGGFIAEVIWGSIWRVAKWLIKKVVFGGIRLMLRWLVVPVLEAVAGFMLTPAGVGLALVGGAAAAGYLVYKAFFSKSSPDVEKAAENPDDELGGRTANAPIVSGDAVPAGAPISVPAPSTARTDLGTTTSTPPAKGLADLITKGESRASNPYQVVNMPNANNGRGAAGTRPLETMTVGQVRSAQRAGDFNAAGRYQIIDTTLDGAIRYLHLTGNEIFDRNLQDRIFNEYLAGKKNPNLQAYLSGRSNDVVAAALDVSHEWASVAAPMGTRLRSGAMADGKTSYYDNSRNNRASIPADQMIATLQQERAERLGSTSVESGGVKMAQGVAVPATTQNKVKQNYDASHPGMTVPVASNNTNTIIKTPDGNLVAANM